MCVGNDFEYVRLVIRVMNCQKKYIKVCIEIKYMIWYESSLSSETKINIIRTLYLRNKIKEWGQWSCRYPCKKAMCFLGDRWAIVHLWILNYQWWIPFVFCIPITLLIPSFQILYWLWFFIIWFYVVTCKIFLML